ncbi:MAG: L-dopachrome tautomerase-related protein [Selenomonadaceae bacterium]
MCSFKKFLTKKFAVVAAAAMIGASGLLAGSGVAGAASVSQDVPPTLTLVATSSFQWSGVTVAPSGRIFVCFPTSENSPTFKIAEMVNGITMPFPSDEMQGTFENVQSIYADGENMLWVLDSAGARSKLCRVDIEMGTVLDTFTFGADVILPDTYLNDVRIDNAGGTAYLTDSGHGGIIVLDLGSGASYRALSDIPEVRSTLSMGIYFPTTGLYTNVGQTDGLELSKDGKKLYFSAMGAEDLYSIPTAVLKDRTMTMDKKQSALELVTLDGVPSDGMTLRGDFLYMGDLADEGVFEIDLEETNKKEAGAILNLKKDIRWANSFATAPDGKVYFTTSASNYPVDQQQPYELYTLTWDDKNDPIKLRDIPVGNNS